jgi:hypothetical protein
MKIKIISTALIIIVLGSSMAHARGGNHPYGGSSYSPGTGSKSSSTYVQGHTTRNGSYVEGHRRSTPDSSFNNNWSTKGNTNPYTGMDGTKVTRPY